MDDIRKLRTASTTSSTSSITDYVNQVFEASELQLSGDVSIEVSGDSEVKKPRLSGGQSDQQKSTNLEDVVGYSPFHEQSTSSKNFITSVRGIRKMYVASLVVLMFPICMGITGTYSATATEDMKVRRGPIPHPNPDQVTWIGSLMPIGALMGGTAAGFFTSTIGRKGTLILNTLPFVIGWTLIMYAETIGLIYIGRVITGFCSGIISVATPMYLVEIATPEVRGLLGASFQLFVVIGILIVSLLGSVLPWRDLALSGGIASLLAGFFMILMPESPVFLMSQKRRGEAKNAIKYLQGGLYDAEAECILMEEVIQSQPKGSIGIREFGIPTVYKPFILSIALMAFQQFSGINAVLFYTVDIFESSGSTMESGTATIIVATVQVFATLAGSLLMDRAGRKPLLMISGACMAVSLIIFGGFYFAKSKDPSVALNYGSLPLVCLIFFVSAFSIGFGPTPWLMVAEMTPPRFISVVSGTATGLNWTFAFIVTKTFKSTQDVIHDYGVYWLYSSICLVSIFVTYFCLPETKGKELEEIQEFFSAETNKSKKSPEKS